MRTLSRYWVGRFVRLFIATGLVATLSIVAVEAMLHFDRMATFGSGLRGALRYLGLRLAAEYASSVLHVAALAAAFLSTAIAAQWREALATRAAGIPPLRLLLPLLACGLVLSAVAIGLHEGVVVQARLASIRAREGDAPIAFRQGSFWVERGARIYNVGAADRARRSLHDVQILERDARGHLRTQIRARRIDLLDGARWRLIDAHVRHWEPDRPLAPPRLEHFADVVRAMDDPRDRALLSADPDTLTLPRLREFIAAREARGASTSAARARLHQRIGDWLAPALLVAAALPIGLGVERTRSLGRSAARATLLLALFYGLRTVAAVLAARGVVPPAAASAGVCGLLGLLATLALLRVPR